MRAALVLALGLDSLLMVGCDGEPDAASMKESLAELAGEIGENSDVCVTVNGSGEWCGPVPGVQRFNVCGPSDASSYSFELSGDCGVWSGGRACVPNLYIDGANVWAAGGYWYSGSVTSVAPGPCEAPASSQCGVLVDQVFDLSTCPAPCPDAAKNRWPSNGRCYVCAEGLIRQPDGNGGAICQPRCQGLNGAALTACNECSIDGGVACRCDQLTGPEQALCTCLAFGGGQACYPPSPTCGDGIKNQSETGVDCGGPCAPCPPPPTCGDGVKNQSETGIDCGGPCATCPPPPTCGDGVKNQGETGIDCGGPCVGPCAPPPPPVPPPTCGDGIQNQSEKGIDCGGPCVAPCPAATCNDGVQNQSEIGIDCGGSCAACPQTCNVGPVDYPTGHGPAALPTALSVSSVAINLGKIPRRAGDVVTFNTSRKACPTLAPLVITGSSGAKKSLAAASGTLTFVLAANNETFKAAVPAAKQAKGWVNPYRICPPDIMPVTCPANVTDTCGIGGADLWRANLRPWKDALSAEIKKRQPLVMLPNPANAVPVAQWIINDAMERPPVAEPAPMASEVSPAALAAAEAAFEAAISVPGAGPFTPADLFRLALDASGCPLDGRCTNEQYIAGVLAGHNVLKNAASVLRNTAPCTADANTKSWMLPGTIGAKPSDKVCTVYVGHYAPGNPSWQGDLIRKLPVARRIHGNVLNLRPNCYDNGNWLGPHYHIFALGLVDWYSVGLGNTPAAVIEYVNQYFLNYTFDWPYLEMNLMQAQAFVASHGLGG